MNVNEEAYVKEVLRDLLEAVSDVRAEAIKVMLESGANAPETTRAYLAHDKVITTVTDAIADDLFDALRLELTARRALQNDGVPDF